MESGTGTEPRQAGKKHALKSPFLLLDLVLRQTRAWGSPAAWGNKAGSPSRASWNQFKPFSWKASVQTHWALIYMVIVHHPGLTEEITSLIPVISSMEKPGEEPDKPEWGKTHNSNHSKIRSKLRVLCSTQCQICTQLQLFCFIEKEMFAVFGFSSSKALSQLLVSLLLVELFMYYQKYTLKIQQKENHTPSR